MADAQASGACGSNTVWVQVPSSALTVILRNPLRAAALRGFCISRECNNIGGAHLQFVHRGRTFLIDESFDSVHKR